ncbi:MAG TPA: hypothetical protein VFJ98_04250 [Mycobacteriales bacterium]|nr:hypothetical protein [Mycobacteriales bacterium]
MTDDAARRGTRDNGLRCGNYTPVADLDPRIADALLDALRDEGIAAYAAPTPAATGGYMETRLPSRPIDRLWVDDTQVTRAKDLVAAEQADDGGATEPDIDAAWQQVLASLQSTPSTPVPPWPVREDLDNPTATDSRLVRPASVDLDGAGDVIEDLDADDEHYVPPPPPPLPRLHRKTVASIAAIVVGLLVLATNLDGGAFTILAVLAIIGGLGSLVWHMHDGPPTDSGWDDGAVV